MKITNPFSELSFFEWALWLFSLCFIFISFITVGGDQYLTLIASLIGATALIFVAKGHVVGQLLTVLFSIVYAIISFKMNYFGEMITYLGMTTPIAIISVVTWLRNPSSNSSEVAVNKLSVKQSALLALVTALVTFVFYFILRAFDTANLPLSTISIATSFSASALMMLRSPSYALAYCMNDIVLIMLWVLATIGNPSYFPMIVCFIIFFANDVYGFINWGKMEARQKQFVTAEQEVRIRN